MSSPSSRISAAVGERAITVEKMNPTMHRPRISGSRKASALAVAEVFTIRPGAARTCSAAMPV
jgi:hypothetical protein